MSRTDTGVVSLMVTIIMMLVISMIVLGFAQISRRQERQSLDRQLSAQAFLAAESGINEARSKMQVALQQNGSGSIPDKTSCDNSSNGAGSPFNTLTYDNVNKMYSIDAANQVGYTCLLVSTKLANIHQVVTYDGPSSTIPIHPQGGALKTLHFVWGVTDQNITPNAATCPGGVQPFAKAATWGCDYGVLRVDMVPTDDLSRNTLLGQQRAFFLYPTNSGGPTPTVNYSLASSKGKVFGMKCSNATRTCAIDITNVSGSNTYALRLSSVYKDGVVDITAADASNNPLKLADAQAEVDSTGKAQDVLRRIQVRMSLVMVTKSPNYALESGSSICKRFMVMTNSFQQGTTLVNDPTNPMCQPGFGP